MGFFTDVFKTAKKINRTMNKINKTTKRIEKTTKTIREYKNNATLSDVDKMTGIEFELFCASLFKKQGYDVKTTKTSGDFGADLVLIKGGYTIVVQVKRYSKNIGVSAIQEIVSAKPLYQADEAWVITNRYFTQSAIQLASANNVKLLNRDSVVKLMR